MKDIVNKIDMLIGEGCGKKKKVITESKGVGMEVFKMLANVTSRDRKKFTTTLHDYIDPMSRDGVSKQVDELSPKDQKKLMDELMDLEYKD